MPIVPVLLGRLAGGVGDTLGRMAKWMRAHPGLIVTSKWAILGIVVTVSLEFAEHADLKLLRSGAVLLNARGPIHLGVFLAFYGASLAAVIACVCSTNSIVRRVALGIVFTTVAMQCTARAICGEGLSETVVQNAWQDRALAQDTVTTFPAQFSAGIACAFAACVAIAATARALRLRMPPRALLVVPPSLALALFFTWRMNGVLYLTLPAPLKVPSVFAITLLYPAYSGPRGNVDISPDPTADQPRVILFVMDESVRADSLGINGRVPDTTPFLSGWNGLINLGEASAVGNASSIANYIVRNGLRPIELPDIAQAGLRRPSVFSYAKAAGYKTIMLDGQGIPGRFLNHMNKHDLDVIDDFWSPPESCEPFARDRVLLDRLVAILDQREKCFIWVNKYGCHFPYQSAFPSDFPEVGGRQLMRLADGITSVAPEIVWNTYLTAVRFSVDGFFRELSERASLERVELVYCSDHGQSILEGPYPSTHGIVVTPPRSQASVPVFLRGSHVSHRMTPEVLRRSRDRSTQFSVFPSLLELMGYPELAVRDRFGDPFWAQPPNVRVFLSGDPLGGARNFLNTFPEVSQAGN